MNLVGLAVMYMWHLLSLLLELSAGSYFGFPKGAPWDFFGSRVRSAFFGLLGLGVGGFL